MDNKIESFTIVLPVKLISKANYRQDRKGDQWRKYQAFNLELGTLIKAILPQNWLGEGKVEGERDLCYYYVGIIANSRLDVGNYSKSILDALERIVYMDDKAVKYSFSYQDDRLSKEEIKVVCGRSSMDNNQIKDKEIITWLNNQI